MPATLAKSFDYEALDAKGKRTKGKVEASSETAAANALRQQGVVPLQIIEAGKGLQRELKTAGLRQSGGPQGSGHPRAAVRDDDQFRACRCFAPCRSWRSRPRNPR